MAYILLNKDGSIPGYSKEAMNNNNQGITPRSSDNNHSQDFYTHLDEESIRRIQDRETRRKEDAKWMIYDKMNDKQLVPINSQNQNMQDISPIVSPRDQEFYTKLDQESVDRIKNREKRRQEDARWMVYDRTTYDKAVPVIGKSSKGGLVTVF